jgi:hypothetical protein
MPSKYAPLAVRQQLENRLATMNECEKTKDAYDRIQDKHAFAEDKARTKKTLNEITPPDLSAEQRPKVASRLDMLRDALVNGNSTVPPMPTRSHMHDSPAGAVGQHLKWESYWKTHNLDASGKVVKVDPSKGERGAVWEMKDGLRTFNKDSEANDPDVANLETIRPDPRNPAVPLADVKHRSYGLSLEAKSKYDEVFPDHEPTHVEAKLEPKPEPRRKRAARVIAPGTPLCQAKRPDGTQCTQPALDGKSYCFSRHHAAQFNVAAAPVASPTTEAPLTPPSEGATP